MSTNFGLYFKFILYFRFRLIRVWDLFIILTKKIMKYVINEHRTRFKIKKKTH